MRIRCNGGCTFAEHPDVAAPEARLIWHAELDPGALHVEAMPAGADDPDAVDPAALRHWLATVVDRDGLEHAVLSDGRRHIRLEVDTGTLTGDRPVLLRYLLSGLQSVDPPLLTLRRFLHLCRHRRFSASLFPRDVRLDRLVLTLRVRDALDQGASQREIAAVLFGRDRVAKEWGGDSDSLRSRVRRLIVDARFMAHGGFRSLMIRSNRSPEGSKE